MGLDLKLLPFSYESSNDGYSGNVISLRRRTELFLEIQDIETKEVPDTFETYLSGEDFRYIDVDVDPSELPPHFGNTTEDRYGDPLEWCFIKNLLELSDHEGVQDNPENRAAWAYLKELPDKKKVALFWQ